MEPIITLETYNKTMQFYDIDLLDYQIQHIRNIDQMLSGVMHRFEHPHRVWEYGLALGVLRRENIKIVLDVGGGGSAFAPACAWLDIYVDQIDPGDCSKWVQDQSKVINKHLNYKQADFMTEIDLPYDAVVCLSVIEHVPDYKPFLIKLARNVKSKGMFILTTDFHPSGIAQVDGHFRTYNKESMMDMIHILAKEGLFIYGNTPDYTYEDVLPVNDYTFASIVMQKG